MVFDQTARIGSDLRDFFARGGGKGRSKKHPSPQNPTHDPQIQQKWGDLQMP
jgi:hypothetical protein